MQKQPIYSIVDLETTGTSWKNDNRIIQIGCVLVQNQTVINKFQTTINPRIAIPENIEQLTGINTKMVRNSPFFDDVAGTIYSLLSDTIFVAHNVDFDFPFLNAELEKAGYPALEIPAIDTVTLSQILFPTAQSYRLRDLTTYLNINHDNPHTADSDALATSKLLQKILERVHELPTVTLQAIINLKIKLPLQSSLIFSNEFAQRRSTKLASGLYIKNQLALRKEPPIMTTNLSKTPKYPSTKPAKQKAFGTHLKYRGGQAKMMNTIFNNYHHQDTNSLIIEAGTGIGKTLGYLFPLMYLSYPDKKVVISTATQVLQHQMAKSVMTQLNQILPFQVNCVVIKGNHHYLDLAKFNHSLSVIEDINQIQLIKAQILVWLLQTITGDLDELNFTNHQMPYFNEIMHTGIDLLDPNDSFYEDDFLIRRNKRLEHANIVITNHAYLSVHGQEIGENLHHPYLVVDEAQHLSENILQQSRSMLNFQAITRVLHLLEDLVSQHQENTLDEVFNNLSVASYNIRLLRADLQQLDEAFKEFEQALYRKFMLNVISKQSQQIFEQTVDNQALAEILTPENPLIQSIEQSLGNVHLHFNTLMNTFANEEGRWLASDRYLMNQFDSQLHVLSKVDETLNQFMDTLDKQPEESAFWLTIHQSMEQSTMRLSGGLLTTNRYLSKNIYPSFMPPLFVGATLFSSRRSQFLYQQLDLEPAQTKVKKIESPFDFEHNARLFVAADAPVISTHNYRDYINYLANTIYELTNQNRCQSMILFNSLLTIEQVYSQLRNTDLFTKRDILAQGISGSKEKILKQFATGTDSILLGAASFWEGIDLPNAKLQLLIITRLPFDSPNEVLTKAENNLLLKNGKNPFYNSALPKATLRLRQGLGRLIRTSKDYGVAVILDRRLIERKYGQTMLKTLPPNLPVSDIDTAKILTETKSFFKNRH
ncbi:helicase C-terminal domain-containing protein [Paucilactobacillus sp. N302-9]